MRPLVTKPTLLRYGPAVAMTVVIPFLSLLPAPCFRGVESALPPIHGLDKIVHALLYATWTAAYLHAVPTAQRTTSRIVLPIALAATLYGAVMEICQKALTSTRCLDPFDALANAVGAFASALLAYVWARHRMACNAQKQTSRSTSKTFL